MRQPVNSHHLALPKKQPQEWNLGKYFTEIGLF